MSFISTNFAVQRRNYNLLFGDSDAVPALGGNFVASGGATGGPGFAAKFSADGVDWVDCNIGVGQYIRCVAQTSKGYFAHAHPVAGSTNGRLTLSTSVLGGTLWNQFQTGVIAGLPLTAIVQAGGQSLACSESLFVSLHGDATNVYVLTSPDFVTWTLRATYATATYGGVVCIKYLNGRFVILFANAAGVNVVWNIASSTDGVTWGVPVSINPLPNQNAAASGQAESYSMHFFKGEYYFLGNDRRPGRQCIAVSSDLLNWSIGGGMTWGGFSGSPYRAADNGSLLVCSGSNAPFVYTSSDGRTWAEEFAPLPAITQFNQIKYKNGIFAYTYGAGGYAAYSATGTAFVLSADVIGDSYSSGIV